MQSPYETEIKIIVVGNGRVGKTCLINRFANGLFLTEYRKTLGADFLERRTYIESVGDTLTFFLWDTAGQEEYDCITRSYYKGAGCAIVAFSLVDIVSFQAVPGWVQKVRDECGTIPIVLVQTKTDLQSEAVVSARDTDDLSQRLGCKLFRVCSVNNVNIDQVFEQLSLDYVRARDRGTRSSERLEAFQRSLAPASRLPKKLSLKSSIEKHKSSCST